MWQTRQHPQFYQNWIEMGDLVKIGDVYASPLPFPLLKG